VIRREASFCLRSGAEKSHKGPIQKGVPLTSINKDSLNTERSLEVGGTAYSYFSLKAAAEQLGDISRLPNSLKVLLENMLRHENGQSVTIADAQAIVDWQKEQRSNHEIGYRPARVLMQDFTGVPAVVDLAAMRDAMASLGGDPAKINPLSEVDLVIDHSVMVDRFGTPDSFSQNVQFEMKRNRERYEFLRWGQQAFDDFRVVPPGTGICHQVNLEYLAKVVWSSQANGKTYAYPDTLVGTDSHTTMINGLGVLGWGVGGIEAEAAMLGQPISMIIPEVVGFKLVGALREGTTATDLVLTVTHMLRERGVVGKFVEFFGPGVDQLSLADQATIANMAPEYGATCGFFPIDQATIDYLCFTGRDEERVALVEAYAKAQGLWRQADSIEPLFSDQLELDISTVEPSLAGPKRPQDTVLLSAAAKSFAISLENEFGKGPDDSSGFAVDGEAYELAHGHVVIAAITSCTNTSNPSVMLAAGLLARNALARGLNVQPWVKTSLAPGSQVVTDYLERAGLQDDLDALGFNLVGYGCTTCIGNSGPLASPISKTVNDNDLVCCSVLSGNRNFEGRISSDVKANYLASPPLVVAYALAGSLNVDLMNEALGNDSEGNPVFLKDIWPSNTEISEAVHKSLHSHMFTERYASVFTGDEIWKAIPVPPGLTYRWRDSSTYIQHPPYFESMTMEIGELSDIKGCRVLALLGDSITTDHISPAGAIKANTAAGQYLISQGVEKRDFNSYGSRRGNHQVMMRGTFANLRLKNLMAPGTEGGWTRHMPDGEQMPIYDAAMKYKDEGVGLVVMAGKEYGAGSSRDWAAKGTLLLGVRAVIAGSFERIHRSNLIGMGVLPLQFKDGAGWQQLGLDGSEVIDLEGIGGTIEPGQDIECTIHTSDGQQQRIELLCRIDTSNEVEYYRHGGILQYVLRKLAVDS
jgi:aconitate hydratase